MPRNLILCNTLFQTYVALLLSTGLLASDENDLLFKVRGAGQLAKRIEEESVFHAVYTVDHSCQHETVKQIACKLTRCKCLPKEILHRKYDAFFAFNASCFEEEVFAQLYQKNPNIQICSYDEGFSSYVEQNKLDARHAYFHQLLQQIGRFRGKASYLVERYNKKYLLEPALYCGAHEDACISERIPVEINDAILEKMNRIFDYKEKKEYQLARILFLDQPFDNDRQSNDDCELFKIIMKEVGEDQCLVRLHPRSKNRYLDCGCKVEQSAGMPWEMVVLNLNTDRQLLVTVNSSSCLTGSLLYKKKAHVLLLYRLLPGIIHPEEYSAFDRYYQRAAEVLKIDLKIPNNIQELKSFLREYQ